ncbi:hypothetical protein [Labilithrix luteola]|uniref:hypothetical protein n=1 Tax=Labilithrix luteola TaxID=1391654 RepID=UPI0011BAD2F6|nr:hypothetical protein [Labilithrix luteola]
MRIWSFTLVLVACRGGRSLPPSTSTSVPSASFPPPHDAPPPEAWFSGEPILRDAVGECELDEIDERWEHRGSRCVHSRSVQCARGDLSGKLASYCSALGYGAVETKRFKIDYELSCSGKAGGIVVTFPWRRTTFRQTVDTVCNSIEPPWVAVDGANVSKLLGQSPIAAHWARRWHEVVSDTWEVEWASGAIEESALDAALQGWGYPLVSSQASYQLWSAQKDGEYSFTLAKGGYRDNRLIVSRRLRRPEP